MPFTRPTLTQIVTRIQSDITTRITGATTLLRRSILKVLAKAYGGVVHLLYGNIEYNKDQMFMTTADAENLETQTNELGVSKNAAAKATGIVAVTGTSGTVIPINTELQGATGQVYLTDASGTISGGTVNIDITAKVAGSDGNEDAGATLTFVSPITGADTSATVSTAAIDGGTNEETDEALRTRGLRRKRKPPHGGADFDYIAWMLEVSGVTRAWSIPLYQGVGTIGCAFVRDDDDDLLPSPSEIGTVKSYIVAHNDPITGTEVGIPTGAEPGLYMITLSKKTVNFSIGISPNTTDVQTAVTSNLNDLIDEEGGPAETIYLSQIRAAISAATGEDFNRVISPTEDVTAATNEVHVIGTITFTDY